MSNKAKLFMTGRTQAVRLTREYRFEGTEVFIRRDSETGEVVLSRKPDSWQGFFDVLNSTTIPVNFMDDRQQPAAPRNPFEGWAE